MGEEEETNHGERSSGLRVVPFISLIISLTQIELSTFTVVAKDEFFPSGLFAIFSPSPVCFEYFHFLQKRQKNDKNTFLI